jgi:thiol:disulfide interchange protein DsbD
MLDRFLLIAGSLLLAVHALAADLLDPSVAFRTAARLVKPGLIEVRYDTAPGYYLYRDRLEFRIQPAAATLGKPQLPPGKVKQDEFFGKSVIYRNRTIVRIPVSSDSGENPLTLIADLQGCADIGVCYPPVRRTLPLAGVTGTQ